LKAVILAAGIASRLRPLTDKIPKCLLTVGEESILERSIRSLTEQGIHDFVIVTGFRAEQIEDVIRQRFASQKFQLVYNDLYASTNNIYSLWLAKKWTKGAEIVLLDSDIIFDRRILEVLFAEKHPDCLALRSNGTIGREEMKVRTTATGFVQEIAKTIAPAKAAGESIGIEKFSPDFTIMLFDILDRMIVSEQKVDKFYELAFQEVVDGGQPLKAVDVGRLRCIEIDTPDDLSAAQSMIKKLK